MERKIRAYTLHERIGTGGFGEVYRATQAPINREVAMKLILPLHANEDEFINRFEFEAGLISRLEHPHIVPLFDYWREADGAYLVMRYIRGGSLADKLLLDGPFSIEQAARLLEQIAGALHVAHRNKVVHQDIKPANILLDEDGNAYLTDFGIARDMEKNINLAQDENNVLHGSPKYISPEHLRRKEITHKSDIYSLGILMFEVLTGEPPFDSSELLELLQKHVRSNVPPLQEKRPDIPPELNQPIIQATLKDPDSRYNDVLEMSRDFSEIVFKITRGGNQFAGIGARSGSTADLTSTMPVDVYNPYLGLQAFQEGNADFFFGRTAMVESLKKRMEEIHTYQRFLAVVGPSGSGKSSVVRAGLIPLLRKGELKSMPPLFIHDMIPGNQPMRSLEGLVLKSAKNMPEKVLKSLGKDDFDLASTLQETLPKNGELLLFIDQFEEVFTLATDEKQRRHFLETIYKALTAENSRLRVIVTLRADFLDRPLNYGDWGDLFRTRMELIPPMKPSELREAIQSPADRVGLLLEEGLTETLISEVQQEIGSLPLLQYTLSELFERRNVLKLTFDAYHEIGGISGALAKRADEILKQLPKEQQQTAKLIFPRLVKLGDGTEDTRHRVTMDVLFSVNRPKETIQGVLDAFGHYRLLTFDNDPVSRIPTVEITHEALIRSWHVLKNWLDENRDDLRAQERLAIESNQWKNAGDDVSFLVVGARLEQYRSLLNHPSISLTETESRFLKQSLDREQQIQREKQQQVQRLVALAGVASIAAVIAIALSIYAYGQRNSAIEAQELAESARVVAESERDRADNNANIARSRELASSALLYRENQPDRALLLSLQALNVDNTFEARNALLNALQTQPRLLGFYFGQSAFMRATAVSADGSMVAGASRNGTIIIWDAQTQVIRTVLESEGDDISDIVFSPDGQSLAVSTLNINDNRVKIWNIESGEVTVERVIAEDEIRTIVYTTSGNNLFGAGESGAIHIWDSTALGEDAVINAHEGVIYALALSPDGSILASGGEDNNIKLWNTRSLQNIITIPAHTNWVLDIDFAPSGQTFVSGSADNSVRHWSVADGSLLWGFQFHRNWSTSVQFSADGNQIYSGDLDGTIVFWNTSDGSVSTAFRNIGTAPIRDFSLIGNRLIVGGDSTALNALSVSLVPRLSHRLGDQAETINAVAVSSDGQTIASAGGEQSDFDIYLWNTQTGTQSQLVQHTGTVTALTFAGDRLVSVGLDRRAVVWQGDSVVASIPVDDVIFSVALFENTLALGLNNGDIELWNIAPDQEPQQITVLQGHRDRVNDLAFSPDGSRIASAGRDEKIIVWQANDYTTLYEITGHSASIETLTFSPDGELLASGSRDLTVRLWNVADGSPNGRPLAAHTNWVVAVQFSPDGQLLASAGGDGTVILWDYLQQRQLGLPMSGHSDWITAIEFLPDSSQLVSVGRDRQVILWDTSLISWEQLACAISNRSFDEDELRQFFNQTDPPAQVCQ